MLAVLGTTRKIAKWSGILEDAAHQSDAEPTARVQKALRPAHTAAARLDSMDVAKVMEACPRLESESSEDAPACAICQVEFHEEEYGYVFKGCRHPFHVKCMNRWLEKGDSCPCCRKALAEAVTQLDFPDGYLLTSASIDESEISAAAGGGISLRESFLAHGAPSSWEQEWAQEHAVLSDEVPGGASGASENLFGGVDRDIELCMARSRGDVERAMEIGRLMSEEQLRAEAAEHGVGWARDLEPQELVELLALQPGFRRKHVPSQPEPYALVLARSFAGVSWESLGRIVAAPQRHAERWARQAQEEAVLHRVAL